MSAVPPLRTHARAVPALAVLLASGIAGKLLAAGSRPAWIAPTLAGIADAVLAAVQVAQRCKFEDELR